MSQHGVVAEVILHPAAGVAARHHTHGDDTVAQRIRLCQPDRRGQGRVRHRADGGRRGRRIQRRNVACRERPHEHPEIIHAALKIIAPVAPAKIVRVRHQRRVQAVREKRDVAVGGHRSSIDV